MGGVTLQCHDSRSTDIDEHAAALPGWEQCYTQLDSGPFRGSLTQVDLPGVSLFTEDTNLKLRQEVVPPKNSIVFGFPLAGSAPALYRGHPVGTGSVLVVAGSAPSEVICQERMNVAAVVLDLDKAESWGFDGDSDAFRPPTSTALAAPAGLACGLWIQSLIDDLTSIAPVLNDETALFGLPALIAARCLALIGGSESRQDLSPSQRYRIVAEARAMVEGADADLPALPVIARRLGVSVRTLEYCFAETLGLSPTQFIRITRLNGARRDLKAAITGEATVADIAMKWGFWHLGRFSAAYRDLFGESPSETLKRRARGG